jgi:drug/metabolite transporter (DMT)-like permease
METKLPSRSVLIAFVFAVLFAGNNAIAVHYSNAELPPFFGGAIRLTVASLILFILVMVLRLPLPRGRGLVGAILFGVVGAGLNFALLYYALEHIQPGLSMVLLALVPLLTFAFACLHRLEVFRWKALLGSILAVFGIGVIVWNQLSAHVPLMPMLAVVGAAACFAESNIIIKSFPQSHPITTNAIALATGSTLLFGLSVLWRETPAVPTLAATWEALIYLVIFGSVATFVLFVYVTKNWTASASSYQFVLVPIVTITVSALLTHEPVTPALLVGGVLVLFGVYIGVIANPERMRRVYTGIMARLRPATTDC